MFATHKLMGAGGVGGESFWVSLIGDIYANYVFAVAVDSADNIISAVNPGLYNHIIKQAPDGSVVWIQQAGSSFTFRGICIDASDNIIVVGYFSGSPTKAAVLKFNSAGTLLWQKGFNGAYSYNVANCVTADSSGNIYVGGEFAKSASYADTGILKLDSSGNILWQRRLSVTTYEGYPYGIVVDGSGNVFVAGYYWKSSGGYTATYLVKYNSSGTYQWKVGLDVAGNTTNAFRSMKVDVSGNMYIAGYNVVVGGTQRATLAKYNSAGVLQWNRVVPSVATDDYNAVSVALDSVGGVYMVGSYKATPDALIVKYNTSGTLQWSRGITGTGTEYGLSVDVDSKDAPILAGASSSDGAGQQDALTARLYPDGSGTGAIGPSLTYSNLSLVDTASPQSVITPAVTDTTISLTASTLSVTFTPVSLTQELFPL